MKEIHVLQQVPFEGPGTIAEWAEKNDRKLRIYRVYENEFPKLPVDGLIVMGGPYGVADAASLPWMIEEMQLIKQVMDSGAKVLGICLGAQLIADVLGSYIYDNDHKEIGWLPIRFNKKPKGVFAGWPEEFSAFHWHSQQFEIPEGTTGLMRSQACRNQAFAIDDRVVALQFHLEMTPEGIEALCDHCPNDLSPGIFVQSKTDMLSTTEHVVRNKEMLFSLLDKLFA